MSCYNILKSETALGSLPIPPSSRFEPAMTRGNCAGSLFECDGPGRERRSARCSRFVLPLSRPLGCTARAARLPDHADAETVPGSAPVIRMEQEGAGGRGGDPGLLCKSGRSVHTAERLRLTPSSGHWHRPGAPGLGVTGANLAVVRRGSRPRGWSRWVGSRFRVAAFRARSKFRLQVSQGVGPGAGTVSPRKRAGPGRAEGSRGRAGAPCGAGRR